MRKLIKSTWAKIGGGDQKIKLGDDNRSDNANNSSAQGPIRPFNLS